MLLLGCSFFGAYRDRALGSIDLSILGFPSLFLVIFRHLSSEALRSINMVLKVPHKDATIPTPARDNRADIAPPQGIGGLGMVADQYHVGSTRLRFGLVLHTLLKINVPDKDLWEV